LLSLILLSDSSRHVASCLLWFSTCTQASTRFSVGVMLQAVNDGDKP
jgi:hypothetical protein